MIVEVATFKLAGGVDEADFLAADVRIQTEFVPNLPGFLRRTTARGEDGEWLVMVLWGSREEADAAGRLAEEHPVVREFMSLVDAESYSVSRYETLD